MSIRDPFGAEEALKFIVGAFLCVGLFSAVTGYGAEVYFLVQEGENPVVHTVNLTEKKSPEIPNGLVEVTGYPSRQTSYEWVDLTGNTLDSLTYYYYVLLPDPNSKPESLVIVQNKEYESNYSNYKVPEQDPQKKKTVRGISGYYAHAEGQVVDFLKKNYGITDPEKIHVLQEGDSPSKVVWLYFFGTFIPFLFGFFLLSRWIWLVKKYL